MILKNSVGILLYIWVVLPGFAGPTNSVMPLPANNCSYNSLITAILLLDARDDARATKAIEELNVGGPLKAFSLSEIGEILQKLDLSVTAYKDVKFNELNDILGAPNKVAILHLGRSQGIGHFIVLKKLNALFRAYDYPFQTQDLTLNGLEDRCGQAFTGNILTISNNETGARDFKPEQMSASSIAPIPQDSVPPIKSQAQNALRQSKSAQILFSPEVVVERSLTEPDILEGVLTIKSTDKRPVSITNIRGACSCFLGSAFENHETPVLGLGDTRRALLRFNDNAFNFTKGTSVALETRNADNQRSADEIKITAQADDTRPLPILYPRAIYFSGDKASDSQRRLILLVPDNCSMYGLKEITYDKEKLTVKLERSYNVTLQVKQYRAMEFDVENRMPKGDTQTISVELNTVALPVIVKTFNNYL